MGKFLRWILLQFRISYIKSNTTELTQPVKKIYDLYFGRKVYDRDITLGTSHILCQVYKFSFGLNKNQSLYHAWHTNTIIWKKPKDHSEILLNK